MSRWIDERIKIYMIDDIHTSSTRLPMEKLQIQYVAETFLYYQKQARYSKW